MAQPTAFSWDMYDPRMTIKAEAGEDITVGEACFVHSDGKIYVCDNVSNAIFHGCALKDYASGVQATLVTHGRLYTTVSQTIGSEAMVPNTAGGAPPSTAGGGTAVAGYAIAQYLIFVHVGRGTDT